MEMERLPVTCRPAQENDTADMYEITKDLWDGHDYVPQMWAEWLADPYGALLVAEYEGRVIGLGKLSRQSDRDWWLHGLRVHPEYQGRGIAAQIHRALMTVWERSGSGAVRLITYRPQVRHLCEQLGFTQVNEYSEFSALAIDTPSETIRAPVNQEVPTLPFRTLGLDECAEAALFAAANPAQAVMGDLMDVYWERVPPRAQYLEPLIEQGLAWWWRGRQGLLTAYKETDDESGQPHLYVGLLACQPAAVTSLLLDYRRLAASLEYTQVRWSAALHPALLPCIEAAGFSRAWDGSVFVYAKEKGESVPLRGRG